MWSLPLLLATLSPSRRERAARAFQQIKHMLCVPGAVDLLLLSPALGGLLLASLPGKVSERAQVPSEADGFLYEEKPGMEWWMNETGSFSNASKLCVHTGIISLYDCVFDKSPGYNQKLHRDDREHAKSLGLHVNEEERQRPVAVLTSSVYGRRIHQPVEPLNRDHGRANLVKADFYRKNDIPGIKSPGFGHVSPA